MYHCTKCIKQFSALKTEDDDVNDEQYEVCPHCQNDMYLENGFLPKELLQKLISKKVVVQKPVKNFFRSRDEWLALEKERYLKEDKYIDSHINSKKD
jgi:hypothetical protein